MYVDYFFSFKHDGIQLFLEGFVLIQKSTALLEEKGK